MRSFPFLILVLACSFSLAAGQPSKHEPQRKKVVIENLKFKPDVVEILVGDSVVWVNDDDADHTVTAEDGSFTSGRMGTGKSYEHKFDKAGRYPYVDDLHPRMKGIIIVK